MTKYIRDWCACTCKYMYTCIMIDRIDGSVSKRYTCKLMQLYMCNINAFSHLKCFLTSALIDEAAAMISTL